MKDTGPSRWLKLGADEAREGKWARMEASGAPAPLTLSLPLPSASAAHIPQRVASSASLATWVLSWVSCALSPQPPHTPFPPEIPCSQRSPSTQGLKQKGPLLSLLLKNHRLTPTQPPCWLEPEETQFTTRPSIPFWPSVSGGVRASGLLDGLGQREALTLAPPTSSPVALLCLLLYGQLLEQSRHSWINTTTLITGCTNAAGLVVVGNFQVYPHTHLLNVP